MFVIAIIAYNNDDRKTANVLFVCLHCILRRTNSFSCQWHLFFKTYKDLVAQGLVFYIDVIQYMKARFFFFFCMNRLHIKILIAYRQKISTTAIIAIGVIGVVNNIPPTNKQVLPHNKYTYGFEMSFFKLYRRWNLCLLEQNTIFQNTYFSMSTCIIIWKNKCFEQLFFQFDLLLIKWRQSSFYPVLM